MIDRGKVLKAIQKAGNYNHDTIWIDDYTTLYEEIEHLPDEPCERCKELEKQLKDKDDIATIVYMSAKADCKARIRELEKNELQIIKERDIFEDYIDKIADELGDNTEWSSCNNRADNCIKLINLKNDKIKELEGLLRESVDIIKMEKVCYGKGFCHECPDGCPVESFVNSKEIKAAVGVKDEE